MPTAPPQTLARERVTAAVERVARGRVVVPCASAGSGKTTAVINWVRARATAVACRC